MSQQSTDDTTAQSADDTDETAAELADHIATALTTSTTESNDDNLLTTFQAARPRAHDTTRDTKALVTAATDADLFTEPVTVALDVTSPEAAGQAQSRADGDSAYVTAAIVEETARIVLAVVELPDSGDEPGIEVRDDALAGAVDDLLTHVCDAVTVGRVIADKTFHRLAVRNTFDQHDVTYLVPKPHGLIDTQIVDDLRTRPTASVGLWDPIQSEPDQSHTATAVYVPTGTTGEAPRATSTDDSSDEYAVFLTNQDLEIDDIDDVVNHYTERMAVELRAAALRDITQRSVHGREEGVNASTLPEATGVYNLWQLTQHGLVETELPFDIETDAIPLLRFHVLLEYHLTADDSLPD